MARSYPILQHGCQFVPHQVASTNEGSVEWECECVCLCVWHRQKVSHGHRLSI